MRSSGRLSPDWKWKSWITKSPARGAGPGGAAAGAGWAKATGATASARAARAAANLDTEPSPPGRWATVVRNPAGRKPATESATIPNMRPEILFPLFAPIVSLKGVGPRIAPLLERVAGPLVRDVLFVSPQRLVRRTLTKVADAVAGEEQTLAVTIDAHQRPGRAGHALEDPRLRRDRLRHAGVLPARTGTGSGASEGRAADRQRPGRAQRVRPRAADRPSGLHGAGRAGRRRAGGRGDLSGHRRPAVPQRAPLRTRSAGARARRCRSGRTRRGWRGSAGPAGATRWRRCTTRRARPTSRRSRRPAGASPTTSSSPTSWRWPSASPARKSQPAPPIAASAAGRPGRGRPAVPPHRRAGPLAGRNPRRPGVRRADEPAGAGRRRLGQDRGRDAGDGRRRRTPACSRR